MEIEHESVRGPRQEQLLRELIAEQARDMVQDARGRISRDSRLVSQQEGFAVTEGLLKDDGCYQTGASTTKASTTKAIRRPLGIPHIVDPAEQEIKRLTLEAIEGLAEQPVNCVMCGKRLRGDAKEPRVTVVQHSGEGQNRAAVYCTECFAKSIVALPTEQTEAEWLEGRSELEKQVWHLWANERLKYWQIVARLANQYQRLNQQKVGRIVREIKAAMLKSRRATRRCSPYIQ